MVLAVGGGGAVFSCGGLIVLGGEQSCIVCGGGDFDDFGDFDICGDFDGFGDLDVCGDFDGEGSLFRTRRFRRNVPVGVVTIRERGVSCFSIIPSSPLSLTHTSCPIGSTGSGIAFDWNRSIEWTFWRSSFALKSESKFCGDGSNALFVVGTWLLIFRDIRSSAGLYPEASGVA